MRKNSFASICAALSICVNTNVIATTTITIDSYISKYRLVAQLESFRSGIPASIILAQGILESGFGNSQLSIRSKNHFGIKWKGKNDGDFVYSYDDDYDKNGKHIPSKFVKYSTVEESYQHHTDFLLKRPHYKPLFKYKSDDFISWAYGLKACGYSTDSNYGAQLIQLIRRYRLHHFDLISKKEKNNLVADNTKKLINIFKGKAINPFTFLKTQTEAVESFDKKIADMPKVKMETKTLECQNIPSDENSNETNKWAFFKSLISSKYWLG